mmetsp:Transcript_3124/g.2692  ORF Transcript_3124/g.2692 Transcript_3124/m.2692 type:complete len:122 (+) Transcript_3124:92-457(+)
MAEKKSIYERAGGEEAVEAVVETFYKAVLADELLKPFFATTDMNKQKKQQKHFMMMAFGGPNKYSGNTLRKAHAKMAINDKHFDAVAGHLKAALEEHKVAEDIINDILAVVEGTRNDVLNK